MHELAPDDVIAGLNQTHAVARFAAPLLSEYRNAKVCVAPDPELGVAESAVTAATEGE